MIPLHQPTIIRMERIERSTFGLSDQRSNHLSYIRETMVGIEPTNLGFADQRLNRLATLSYGAYGTRTRINQSQSLVHYHYANAQQM